MLSRRTLLALFAQGPAKLPNAPQWLKKHDVPSLAVASIENHQVAWTSIHGEQSPGVPASAKTLYNVASLTKPVTAETILRLVSAGKLDLDEPMAAHWVDPDLAQNPWHKLLTPRLALSHQTGFKNWRYETNNVLRFEWEPGTKTGYSGEGYDYVARFAERKLQRPFEELAREYVLDPIGMPETSFTHRPSHEGRLAHPRKAPVKWSAADLLHTTIADYAKFVTSVMANQRITPSLAAERLVLTRNMAEPRDVRKVCSQANLNPCAAQAGMGLGWEILQLNGETLIRHTGSDPGVRTLALFVPARRSGLVAFTNGQEGNKVIREVLRNLYPNPLLLAIS